VRTNFQRNLAIADALLAHGEDICAELLFIGIMQITLGHPFSQPIT
jgi:hypothetical protein